MISNDFIGLIYRMDEHDRLQYDLVRQTQYPYPGTIVTLDLWPVLGTYLNITCQRQQDSVECSISWQEYTACLNDPSQDPEAVLLSHIRNKLWMTLKKSGWKLGRPPTGLPINDSGKLVHPWRLGIKQAIRKGTDEPA